VIAPAEVRIESTRGATPAPVSTAKPKSKRSPLSRTLTSEGVTAVQRVGVERRGPVPDRKAARAVLVDALKEVEQKLESSKGPVLITMIVTVEVAG
jgi:hypothetical protein